MSTNLVIKFDNCPVLVVQTPTLVTYDILSRETKEEKLLAYFLYAESRHQFEFNNIKISKKDPLFLDEEDDNEYFVGGYCHKDCHDELCSISVLKRHYIEEQINEKFLGDNRKKLEFSSI